MKLSDTPHITVAIRKRPLNKKQLQRSETDVIRVGQGGEVVVSECKQKVDLTKYIQETSFHFDYAYDENSSNQQIYEQSIRPLIENAFMGAKISCFAYGQTGSGKTFTMKGDINKGIPGMYYLGARQIFNYLKHPQFQHLHVDVSFYQIYCGKLFDLLNNRFQLKIREDKKQNINIIDLKQKQIFNADEFLQLIQFGSSFRVTSQNATNLDSSRSHAILQITLKNDKKVFTKISFIDLAGNERGADHMDQNKQTKIDGAQINKSLLSLKECIRALDQDKGHIPFRGSKLTMVLKDSFIGYCKTVMIGNVSPNVSSSENTMNTLRYADRVKELKRGGDCQPMNREQMLARELMLPRGNNKNCIKVSIENNDDQYDIMLKIDAAKKLNTHQYINHRRTIQPQQKMDIEQPSDYQHIKPHMPVGRKTQNVSNDIRMFNGTDKRPIGNNKEIIGMKHVKGDTNMFKNGDNMKMQYEKAPLLLRNNNLNVGNNANYNANQFDPKTELKKGPKHFTNSNSSQNVHRTQFDALQKLRNGFQLYKEDHQVLLKEQMMALKNEMMVKEQFRSMASGDSYQDEIMDVDNYLNLMEMSIMAKLEIFTAMKTNLDNIKMLSKNAQEMTARMRYEQQQGNEDSRRMSMNNHMNMNHHHINMNHHHINTNANNMNANNMNANSMNGMGCKNQNRLHYHSFNNGINLNSFNNSGEQQLLEGLPGDDSISRLF